MIISYRQFDLKLTGGYFDEIFNELIRNSNSVSIIIVGVETNKNKIQIESINRITNCSLFSPKLASESKLKTRYK